MKEVTNRKTSQVANFSYQNSNMQKEMILQKIKEQGCRITKQRKVLLDIILSEECSSCKEIYYKAVHMDSGIGAATVYRMINTLEDIGAISRKNMYKIACGEDCNRLNACRIELDDNTILELSAKNWQQVIQAGLRTLGYVEEQSINNVTVKPCEC